MATLRNAPDTPLLDGGWARALGDAGPARAAALLRLRDLLIAVGWFELERRRPQLSALSNAAAARLVADAADEAAVAVLAHLDDYHGQSRFQVWVAKFAIHEVASAARRTAANAR